MAKHHTPIVKFSVAWTKGSNDVVGWNGWLVDKSTGKRITLHHYEVFEEFQGERTWMRCAFPTKADLTAAAIREARKINKGAT